MSEETPLPELPPEPPERAPRINVPILVASLLMSLMLWGMVYTQNSTTTFETVEVSLRTTGLDGSKYAIINPPASLTVKVAASVERIKKLRSRGAEEMFGVINLTRATADTKDAPVTLYPTELREVAVDSLPRVKVTVEEIARKRVPVEVDTVNKLGRDDVSLTEKSANPAEVEVFGPKSMMDNVESAHARLDLSDVNPDELKSYTVQPLAWGRRGELRGDFFRVEPPTVEVTPFFSSDTQQKQVPVSVAITGTPAKGFGMSNYILNPPTVQASGNPGLLAGLQKLEADPIDISGMKADTTFTVAVRRPAGIRLVSPSSVRVRVNIRPMAKTGAR